MLLAWLACIAAAPAAAEDGYELWLRYRPLQGTTARLVQRQFQGVLLAAPDSPVVRAALGELDLAFTRFSGQPLPRLTATRRGALLIGVGSDPRIAALGLDLSGLGEEGYLLRTLRHRGTELTVVAANTDRGLLYGSFALLARISAGATLASLNEQSAPRVRLRMLNHWDNLDGHVERGYAGASLWDWWKLPDVVDPRYTDYARANASIGINAAVVNNVNAVATILKPEYIDKARVLADVLRPYGIRLFLAVRFSSPIELGGLGTADPLDPAVRAWWRGKAEEIYRVIPDFGGFLVKANSEGQPGPIDYGRNHADGANALAEALRPHGGVVLWRAFVYSERDATDRAKQAWNQLRGLDGRFADNVVLQVKNGPIDFQPREPFHPLFGAMPATALGMEFQITKEYLGFATHLAYLGPLYEEVLKADTFTAGEGSTVARIIADTGGGRRLTAMAGVANTGRDRNWSGSQFDQANWFAFGRLAWNPEASAADIASEWIRRTFDVDAAGQATVLGMMMASREAVVDYMTPLGLAHLMGTGHHYGPAPWVSELSRPEWNPVYYHRADAGGIGFDRTTSGSNAIEQYAAPLAARFGDVGRVPQNLLLWFHRVPWQQRLSTGRTLWEELLHHYERGVQTVGSWQAQWAGLAGQVDAARFNEVAAMLQIQRREAQWWRDASIAYWQSINGLPLPAGLVAPAQTLDDYRRMSFPFAPGN